MRCGKLYLTRFSIDNSRKSHYWYEKAAELDNRDAQYECGSNYQTGLGCTRDRKKALYWLERAAQQGHITAIKKCAEAYENGDGCEKNPGTARYWYEKLKASAEKMARSHSAYSSPYQKDVELAEKALARLGGITGTPPAPKAKPEPAPAPTPKPKPTPAPAPQPKPAPAPAPSPAPKTAKTAEELFREAVAGSQTDPEKTLKLYEQAAELGHMVSQYGLALWLIKHDNKQKGLYWLEKSAEQGLIYAQFMLGSLYIEGKICREDKKKALYWYEKAAEQGDSTAQLKCSDMYYMGAGCTPNHQKAFCWLEKSAEQGLKEAQFMLGSLYFTGQFSCSKDIQKARYWLKKAADQGYEDAIHALEVIE